MFMRNNEAFEYGELNCENCFYQFDKNPPDGATQPNFPSEKFNKTFPFYNLLL